MLKRKSCRSFSKSVDVQKHIRLKLFYYFSGNSAVNEPVVNMD